MNRSTLVALALVAFCGMLGAQTEIIYLENPSFEDEPRQGWQPRGWIDCGFAGESPPDVQPFGGFGVTQAAHDDNTYLGLVVRDNKTWEAVSQRLARPIREGQCYRFSIYLARSAQYVSPTKRKPNELTNFNKGAILRIYGGNSPREKAELLASSDMVSHTDWRPYKFEFTPKKSYRYFVLEAYYKTPTMFYYNGNLLLDNASEIYSCEIPEEKPDNPILAQVDPEEKKTNVKPSPKEEPVLPEEKEEPKEEVKEVDRGDFKGDLKAEDLALGDKFRLDNLYFQADSSSITPAAALELNELVAFMKKNKGVSIEVGGHTNGLPTHDYCDKLSRARAKSISAYLTAKGVDRRRISYRGYGKRKPIADNETREGRKRNQRVEIKITKLERN